MIKSRHSSCMRPQTTDDRSMMHSEVEGAFVARQEVEAEVTSVVQEEVVKTATYGKRDHNTDKILEEERVVDLEKKSHWMEERQQEDPVGGILAKYVQEWEKIADPLVLKIVAQGLKLEFLRTPVLVRDPQLAPLPKEQDKLQGIFQQVECY